MMSDGSGLPRGSTSSSDGCTGSSCLRFSTCAPKQGSQHVAIHRAYAAVLRNSYAIFDIELQRVLSIAQLPKLPGRSC